MNSSAKVHYSKLDNGDGNIHHRLTEEQEDGDLELSDISSPEGDIFVDEHNNDLKTNADGDVEDDGLNVIISLEDAEKYKREVELWRMENLAVPMCYFMVGLVQGITFPLINVYPLDLGATEAQQATIWFLKGLPSCLKVFFGFLSDNVPIFGYRRKPYMLLGWTISIASMLVLLLSSDLSLERVPVEDTDQIDATDDDNNRGYTTIPPDNAPSLALLSVVFFLWATGVWLADVMGDSLVAEKAKYEITADRGNLQASCYILRGFGIACMVPISSLTYNAKNGPRYIITATALVPLLLIPLIYRLKEKHMLVPEQSTREQLQELWKTACSRAVWQPMGFISLYLALFVSNAAWREFLKSVLGFTPNQLNALLFVAGALAFAGVLVYKFVLIQWSWRTVFILGISFNGIFSLLQVLLIRGQTFGLDPFLFSLGDDGVRDFLLGTQYLPMMVMMVNLVPEGIEGASYALFTTTWNAASAISDALSTVLLGIWDVSKESLKAGDLSGLTKLTVLTTALQVTPLFFVGLMPHSVEDLNRLKSGNDGAYSASSIVGGTVYLSLVLLSVLVAVFIGVMNVIRPGWMGES